MKHVQIKRLLVNLALLSGTTLLLRGVSLIFNVYVSDKLGAAGMGLMTLVMSVYSFSVTFAASGVNLAATRMTAEAMGRGSEAEIRSAMRRCIGYALCFGCAAALLLWAGAELAGDKLLRDGRTVSSLRLLSLSLPFISLSSAMNGYFTAVRRVFKNAFTQLFEQSVRILLTMGGFRLFLSRGLEYGCLAVVGGSSVAEAVSFCCTLVLYRIDLRRHNSGKGEKPAGLTGRLFDIALPVAFSSYIRSALVTIEHLLIPIRLQKGGLSTEKALASYGVLHGMAFPAVLFPQAVMSAFASLVVPELSELKARGETERIREAVEKIFRAAIGFSIGCAGVMLCFSRELGDIVCDSAEAGEYIRMLAPLIPVMYTDSAADGMLKGLDEQLHSMKINILDSLASIALIWVLLPVAGVPGYIAVIYVCELLNAGMSITRLLNVTDFRFSLTGWVVKPLVCSVASTVIVRSVCMALGCNGGGGVGLAVRLTASSLIYCFLMLAPYIRRTARSAAVS